MIEVLVAAGVLLAAVVTLITSLTGQTVVGEHARNLSWAIHDVDRVLERLRWQNGEGVCTQVNVAPPAGFATWDEWLGSTAVDGGGGKSLPGNLAANELVVVTTSGVDPVEVTVAACWRHRTRVYGECTWTGATLVANPGAGGNVTVTESPAMLSTLVTCRG